MAGVVVPLRRADVDDGWRAIRAILPEGWREAARSCRAIRWNKGPLAEPGVLLRVVLGLAAGNCSLRQTALHARLTELVDVTEGAIRKRLRRCADWLEWIVRGMLRTTVDALPSSTLRLRLLDATCVSKPGSTGTDFRLHVNVSLPDRKITEADLTDAHGGESLSRFTVRAGDVMVADRCYGTANSVAHVAAGDGYVVVRTNGSSLPLFSAQGARVDFLRSARKLAPGAFSEVSVEVRPRGRPPIVGRLCLYALSKAQADKAQQRVRRRKQKRPGWRAIENAKYVFVFTTLPRSYATVRQVFAIYRLRWQVELAFKTLKGVCGFAKLPHRHNAPSRAWLLAKLLCALIADRLASDSRAFPPGDEDSTPATSETPLAVPNHGVRPLRPAPNPSSSPVAADVHYRPGVLEGHRGVDRWATTPTAGALRSSPLPIAHLTLRPLS